jgi:SAM-dependent methyltransferase
MSNSINMEDKSCEEYLALFQYFHADEVAAHVESSWPVTTSAFEKLSEEDIKLIEIRVGHVYGVDEQRALMQWKYVSLPHYRREILRYGCTVEAELLQRKTLMTSANPPPHVHSMMRSNIFAGDLYSGDMIVAAMNRAGVRAENNARYLDFGCSSGALVRNMSAHFPQSKWHACDPVPDSVEWAQQQFPSVDFYCSSQEPPLKYEDAFFHGVYAVSIWSHFSERAALDWFVEMRRVLVPGSFLVFTTHGIRSLYYYLSEGHMSFDTIKPLMKSVIDTGYAFQPIWDDSSSEADHLKISDWGNAYFNLNWVIQHLSKDWYVLDYQYGLNQCNQDIYVLQRR